VVARRAAKSNNDVQNFIVEMDEAVYRTWKHFIDKLLAL
jgi:hypothetical protein